MKKRLQAYIFLLLTAFIWGVATPVIKYTLQFIKPFNFLFWRFFLTSFISLPIFIFYKQKKEIKFSQKKVKKLVFLGLLGTTLPLIFLFIGLRYTTAIDSSLIGSVAPLMVVAGGAIFLKENVTSQEKIGSAISFLGSIITVIQPLLEKKAFAEENIMGNILVLFSTFIWAGYCLLMRQSEKKGRIDPLILSTSGFFVGLLTILPFSLKEGINLPLMALPGIFYMSIFSSLIAYFTYNLGYSLIEASEATLFDYLKPVFAAPLAVIWLGEKITLPFLSGAFFIFLGVFLAEYKKKFRHSRER